MFTIASDHGGLELKEAVKKFLRKNLISNVGISVPLTTIRSITPILARRLPARFPKEGLTKVFLICGTGIGMSIVANKFPGVRAALINDEFTARMSKEHNDANIIVLGGRVLTP